MGCDSPIGYGDFERRHREKLEQELNLKVHDLVIVNDTAENFISAVRAIVHDFHYGTRRTS